MTSAQVVEMSVNVISNSPSQDYTHPDDRTSLNYETTFVGLSATEVKYVEVVFDRHLKIVKGIHSLNGSISNKQKRRSGKGLVSEGIVVLRRRGEVEHKSLLSNKLKRDKFPPRRDNKADVSSVSRRI